MKGVWARLPAARLAAWSVAPRGARRGLASGAAGNGEANYAGRLEEKDSARKKSDVPLAMLKADGSSKRFYSKAWVDTVTVDDPRTGMTMSQWCLTLDGRKARTPANKLLTLPNEALAVAIALEFDVQGAHIQPFTMPMTTLATTAIDQIIRPTVRKSSVDGMMRVFDSDLLCLRSEAPPELVSLERDTWGSITDWISSRYDVPVWLLLLIPPLSPPPPSTFPLPPSSAAYPPQPSHPLSPAFHSPPSTYLQGSLPSSLPPHPPSPPPLPRPGGDERGRARPLHPQAPREAQRSHPG